MEGLHSTIVVYVFLKIYLIEKIFLHLQATVYHSIYDSKRQEIFKSELCGYRWRFSFKNDMDMHDMQFISQFCENGDFFTPGLHDFEMNMHWKASGIYNFN